MSDINAKECHDLVQSLKKMLWGVQSHKNDHGFPRDITEEVINRIVTDVEKSRQDYEAVLSQVKELRTAYQTKFNHGIKNLSRFTDMLYNLYGTQSPIVKQFGLKPIKGKKAAV